MHGSKSGDSGNFKGRQFSMSACLNSACLSKKHANNLQLKMCQAASNQEENYTFVIFYHMYRVYVHIK